MTGVRILRRVSPLILPLVVLFAACGVSYGDPPQGTEFFKSLTISGTRRAGEPLTAAVVYAQKNPTNLDIKCEIRQGKDLVKDIGTQQAPGLPFGGPKATPLAGNFSYDFALDKPGTYKAECFTPKDEDNFIIKTFTLAAASPSAGG
jgi:hypothetical protein